MTYVGTYQDFVGTFAGDNQLRIGQRTWFKRTIDNRSVFTLSERDPLFVGQAEPPGAVVIARDVRNRFRKLTVAM